MHRISSDSEFLDSGKIVIDADGIPIEPVSKQSFEDALEPKADKSYVDSAVAPKADKSYVDSSLAPKADKSYVDSLTPVRSFLGTGSPEGRVTAPVGSVYTDSAATNGAIRWVKTTGTGSTGWRVEYGDTGWRDITSLIEPGRINVGTGGYVRVRRTPMYVEYAFNGATIAALGNVYSTPSGFRVLTSQAVNGYNNAGIFLSSRFWLATTGFIVGAALGPDREYGIRFNADPAWPTSLPGTPI